MRVVLALAIFSACTGEPSPSHTVGLSHATAGQALDVEETQLPEGMVVARWEGGEVTAADLEERVGNELRNRRVRFLLEQYEVRARALDVLVMEALLQAEVRKRGLADVDALIRVEVDEKVPDPTEAEILEYWPIVERQLPGATLDEARPLVAAELLRRGRERRYGAFVDELRQSSSLDVQLPYPDLPRSEVPVSDHDPIQGASDAPVTIVQFAEYQCYYCNRVTPALDRLLQEYDGRVRLVWKDFPLSNHGRAIPAAVAAHCAGEQGRYWEMNRVLLRNQQALTDSHIAGYAKDLGLDPEPFQACMSAGRHEPLVRADMQIGDALGVEATPTFFVNGVLLSGAQPYERFEALVQRELDGA